MSVGYNLYGNPEESLFTDAGQKAASNSLTSGDAASMASMVSGTLSNIIGGIQSYNKAKSDAKIAKINAEIVRDNIKSLNIERALNMSNTRHEARDTIASSRAAMAAMGNIGSSADAGVIQAYKNLDTTLGNMQFSYDTQETSLRNQEEQYKWQAKQAKKAAKKAILSTVLGTVGSAVGAAAGMVAGPQGAMMGAQIGSSAGSAIGQTIG